MVVEREIDISISSLIAQLDSEKVEHVETFKNEDKDEIIEMWKINGNTYYEVYKRKETRINLP